MGMNSKRDTQEEQPTLLQRIDGELLTARTKTVSDTNTFFGFKINDTSIKSFTDAGWNYANSAIKRHGETHVQQTIGGALSHTPLGKGAHLLGKDSQWWTHRLSAAAFVGVSVLPELPQTFKMVSQFFDGREKAKRSLRPVLDDISADHGKVSFGDISQGQNEVIYAHRRRLEQELGFSAKRSGLGFAIYIAGGLVETVTGKKLATNTHATRALNGNSEPTAELLIQTGIPLLGNYVAKNVETGYAEDHRGRFFSAYEMIEGLDGQLKDVDFKDARSAHLQFSLPKEAKRHSLSLEDYITETILLHSRDMEHLDANYVHLRSALRPEVEDVSKMIADAIRAGELPAMGLVRLIGEGHIIKNQGKGVAHPDAVRVAIEKLSGNATNYAVTDSKEYYGDATFDKKDVKEALKSLEGEERLFFAAMLPDAVLKEAGVAAEEIKAIREKSSAWYESKLSELVVGLATTDDKVLAEQGMAKTEIESLRKVAAAIQNEGTEAVHAFRSNASHRNGIERVLTNAMVTKLPAEGREYLGRLAERGQQALKAAENAETANDNFDSANENQRHEIRGHKSHAERLRTRDDLEETLARKH
jgi:hypothetical protein